MSDTIQFDPALKQLLLQTTGSPLGESVPEEMGVREVPVVARLADPDVTVEGLTIISRFANIVTGRVRLDQLVALRQHPNVASLKASTAVGKALAFSVPEIRASADLLRAEFGPAGVTGRGSLIAFADWGCDFAHANLRDPQGGTRLLCLWDQRGGPQLDSPTPFGYGRLFHREQINAALAQPDPYAALGYDPEQSDDGTGTHCTHVMDIAAGNGRAPGSSPGVAPEADLICVHLKGDDTQPEDSLGDSVRVLEALRFMVDCAGDRPLVINMSLGKTGGPHDPSPLVTRALDTLVDERPGRVVVMSGGNYFGANVHSGGQLHTGETANLRWHNTQMSDETAEMEIWYSGNDRFSMELVDPSGASLGKVALGEDHVVREEDRIIASVFHRLKDPNNGDNQIDIFLWPDASSGVWTTRLYGEAVTNGHYHAWIERARPKVQARFEPESATPMYTSGTICNGLKTIAVGAYDARLPSFPLGHFSSAGPTRDGRDLPVISAPGVAIRAARSSYTTPFGRVMNDVTVKSGTSMAAPHVSGVVALMFEAAGEHRLTAEQTREILIASARVEPADREYKRYGAGRVDAVAAIRRVRELVQTKAGQPSAPVEEQEQVPVLPIQPMPTDLASPGPPRVGPPEPSRLVPASLSEQVHLKRTTNMNGNLRPNSTVEQTTSQLGRPTYNRNRMGESHDNDLLREPKYDWLTPARGHDDVLEWLMENAPEAISHSSIRRPRIRPREAESTTAENPVAVAGLGVAVLSLGITVFSGGNLSVTSTPASYIHPNTPRHLPFHQFSADFNIIADHPRYFISNQVFWFNVLFEFNGHDIRDAKINVLRDKSSSLVKSTFDITFVPIAYSLPNDPVAELRFNIVNGRWDPVGSGDFAFHGYLNVRADGNCKLMIEQADDNRVYVGGFANQRTVRRAAPLQVTPFWEVYFEPDSDRLDDAAIRDIRSWVQGLRQDIRPQVENGTVPIVIHGYASTTASVAHNQDLARRRLESVKRVIRDFAGSNVRFTEFNHGKLEARTADRVESRSERRVVMEVTYYDPQ